MKTPKEIEERVIEELQKLDDDTLWKAYSEHHDGYDSATRLYIALRSATDPESVKVREDAEYRADIYERMVKKIWDVLASRGYGLNSEGKDTYFGSERWEQDNG